MVGSHEQNTLRRPEHFFNGIANTQKKRGEKKYYMNKKEYISVFDKKFYDPSGNRKKTHDNNN